MVPEQVVHSEVGHLIPPEDVGVHLLVGPFDPAGTGDAGVDEDQPVQFRLVVELELWTLRDY